MTSTPHPPGSCPACRIIDQADGIQDGNLFPVLVSRVNSENRIVRTFQNAQDRAADTITSFAGSLNFVYIHAFWFGLWILINIGLIGTSDEFDKFPFGLLTMI